MASILYKEREDRIAELIVTLSERDRDARAACVRMMGAISVLARNMNKANRFQCAEVLRSSADEIEQEPRCIC
jgi:hypothetical protein